ncbi:MAG: LPXTG cell wall anchor domain-containing protein, partial [Clostridia bacterium]|nr:LPXTG cell wall anchor domain-containing protein [Clostridia bacterium]
NLTIKGNGTLNCDGIEADDLTINSGTINAGYIDSVDITINGGTIKTTGNMSELSIFSSGSITVNGGNVEATGGGVGLYAVGYIRINGGDVKASGRCALFAEMDVFLGDGVKEENNLQITEFMYDRYQGKGINAASAHFIYDSGSQGGNTGGNTNPANDGGATTNDTPANPAKADPNKAPKTGESNAFVLSMLGIIAVAGMGLYVGKRQEN